jgi:hypothetical protein
MLTGVLQLLDQRPIRKEGGFLVPYTVVVQDGVVAQAYRTLPELPQSSGNTGIAGHGMTSGHHSQIPPTSSSQHGGVGPAASFAEMYAGSLKKEYDTALNTVRAHLNLEEEALVFEVGSRAQKKSPNASIRTLFVERVQRQEYAFDADEAAVFHVEYLSDRFTHNLLLRGDPSKEPFNAEAQVILDQITAENARRFRHAAGNHQQKALDGTALDLTPKGRSGLLQIVVPPEGEHNETIRVTYYSDSSSGGAFPAHASCKIERRRNVFPFHSKQHFGFERLCTFEGPKSLSEDTTKTMSEELRERVLHAVCFILEAAADSMKKYVQLAVFLFKVGSDGNLYLLFCPCITLHSGDGRRSSRPPVFKVPAQYRSMLRRPKPNAPLSYEEDLLDTPVLDFAKLEGRRTKATEDRSFLDEDSEDEEDLYLERLLGNDASRKKGSNTGSPSRSHRGGHSRGGSNGVTNSSPPSPSTESVLGKPEEPPLEVDYDKITSAFAKRFHLEDSFQPSNLERLKSKLRDTNESSATRSRLVSPCGQHPRENPQPSLEALRRRHHCATINNVRSLLHVLEGSRGLSRTLVDAFHLTRSQQQFLESGAQRRAGTAFDFGAHLREDESMASTTTTSKSQSSKKKKKQEKKSSSSSKAKDLLSDKPKPTFDLNLSSGVTGYQKIEEMRERGKSGRPPPLRAPKLKPIWSTGDNTKPVFKSPPSKEERIEKLKRELEECLERQRQVRAKGWGSPFKTNSNHRSGLSDGGSGGSDQQDFELSGPDGELRLNLSGMSNTISADQSRAGSPNQSVQSKNLEFPELIGFAPTAAVRSWQALDEGAGGLTPGQPGLEGGIPREQQSRSRQSHSEGHRSRGFTSGSPILDARRFEMLETLDLEFDQMRRSLAPGPLAAVGATVEDKLEYLLSHATYGKGDTWLVDCRDQKQRREIVERLNAAADYTRRTADYLYMLCYHLTSRSLATRNPQSSIFASTIPTGERRRSSNLDDLEPRLLFSIPSKELGFLEKKVVQFFNKLPYFEQMNTEENIAELQLLLLSTASNSSQGIKTTALTDQWYATHLEHGANIAAIPTFALKMPPPKLEFQSIISQFILTAVRSAFLDKVEELQDEVSTVGAGAGAGGAPIGGQTGSTLSSNNLSV